MKKIVIIIVGLLVGLFIYFLFMKPTNDRVWEAGFDRLSTTTLVDNQLAVTNIHDWKYSEDEIISFDYMDKTYDISTIDRVWFLVEPFSEWQAVAHTYFVFDFANGDSLSFSIEARREKDEKYDGLKGMARQFELFYSWGTENDFTGRRAYKDDADLYMYPLKLSKEQSMNIIAEFASETNILAEDPRFYNTFSSNCTNELAKAVRKINQKALPWYSLYILPGYADTFLYDRGYIDTTVSKDQLREQYFITDIVNDNYPDFKELVREKIENN